MECKRANPALSRWIFGRSHFRSSADGELRQVRLDSINYESVPQIVRAAPEWSDDQYHVGVEIKNNETKGDAGSSGRGALDDAVSQALRGAGGLINEIVRRHGDTVLGLTTRTVVIPVVVTTARLLTWDGDLADADLQTGQLPEGVTVQERPWVWLRVNASDHLRHSAPATQSSRHQHRATSSFGSLADLEYANSVGVVSSTGLEAFLGAASYQTGDH